ncbi:tail fiber assembly protein [Pseudomonas sp. OA65]|uniref:tail fiber assembly protein n=1 Tax=Pseudomonas sp. OA65 TaxID=2818431 RepID=UPI001A9E1B49|nr:tail fiber assembly protein [Pseudomonas sp. OA65]MBO1539589.1 tail fiber assembly protein [Pseudomonas sp. OA65]
MPYYIADIRGFDHSEIPPAGSVYISDEDFQALFRDVASRPGASIVPNRQGYPVLQEAPEPTSAELAAAALVRRDERLARAALRIAPLQDAVDTDQAYEAEVQLLRLWKNYRVELNRIDQQDGFPTSVAWPIEPGSSES